MGKLLGVPLGADACYTNHADADQNDCDNLATLLAAAGCNYFMGVPGGDDVMLSTSAPAITTARRCAQLLGLRPAPEFEAWLVELRLDARRTPHRARRRSGVLPPWMRRAATAGRARAGRRRRASARRRAPSGGRRSRRCSPRRRRGSRSVVPVRDSRADAYLDFVAEHARARDASPPRCRWRSSATSVSARSHTRAPTRAAYLREPALGRALAPSAYAALAPLSPTARGPARARRRPLVGGGRRQRRRRAASVDARARRARPSARHAALRSQRPRPYAGRDRRDLAPGDLLLARRRAAGARDRGQPLGVRPVGGAPHLGGAGPDACSPTSTAAGSRRRTRPGSWSRSSRRSVPIARAARRWRRFSPIATAGAAHRHPPAKRHARDRPSLPARSPKEGFDDPRVLATGLQFPEGPVWLAPERVAFTEIRGQCLSLYEHGRVRRVAVTGGGANGATLGPDGALYVANNGGLTLGHDGRWIAPGADQRSHPARHARRRRARRGDEPAG